MDSCKHFAKGYHYNTKENYYEFKPSLRDGVHHEIQNHMKILDRSVKEKDPPHDGLDHIPAYKKMKMLKDIEDRIDSDCLVIYDIKVASNDAVDAQEFVMKRFLDIKDDNRIFCNFEELQMPETTPLDDLRKCQFTLELKKELFSPISTVRVIIRINKKSPKKHAQNLKLLENMLLMCCRVTGAYTMSQLKYMSDNDKIEMYYTYLGSCNNCMAQGSTAGMKLAFDTEAAATSASDWLVPACASASSVPLGTVIQLSSGTANLETVSMDTSSSSSDEDEGAMVIDETDVTGTEMPGTGEGAPV